MITVENVEEFIKGGYSGWELPDTFIVLDNQLLYAGRWTITCLDVVADPDGHVFGIMYDIPSTEMQEGSESEEVTIVAVDTVMSWSFVR